MTTPADAVAKLFDVQPAPGANYAAEVYPGYPGLVVADGSLQAMAWGFPRKNVSKKTGNLLKPTKVNNARADQIRGNPMWAESFRERRCLIPVSAWAEAEGEERKMTRTWYSLPDHDAFAVGGIWRSTIEWGNSYSMVMVNGCEQMSDVHDRMPTILRREDWDQWTSGTPEEAFALCRTWEGPLIVDRTDVPWYKPKGQLPGPLL
ncbi:SOS response-associated peptidase [Novosphingobium sp. RL4]|uniref:SOS response-associated peptidase n=1 Tax=Novosphingobium sp. RL4 TaxID=3109595 RepID=UPI002D77D8A9|nr:SOS response-associated peptidase family protein [Novosphingobium sp. RL4]WRT94488.1 SOS response-associated peptidase family protein [Novosphingobium sp. RL4]